MCAINGSVTTNFFYVQTYRPNVLYPIQVKVNGLSNYHSKLLSPLLTYHGMDRNTQKAKPLSELTNK